MTGILNIDTIQNEAGTVSLNTSYFQRRLIQRISYTHRIGWWRANNTYYWVPGANVNFRPIRGDSRIKVTFNIPTRQYGSSQHSITHWIFYKDEIEYGRHSRAGHHVENAFSQEWDIPSWGGMQYARIGYKVRSYSEAANNAHLYYTQYWDGAGADHNIQGLMIVEEYTSAAT